jgi:hypothetical protein
MLLSAYRPNIFNTYFFMMLQRNCKKLVKKAQALLPLVA